jgi:uncharacterized protein YigE (DUF2233 family)
MKATLLIWSCFLTLALLLSSNSSAGVVTGKVSSYISNNQGMFFFALNNPKTGKPACDTANAPNGRYAVQTATQQGKNIMDLVINAHTAGKDVQVFGANTCATWSDSEDVSYAIVTGIIYPPAQPIALCTNYHAVNQGCFCQAPTRTLISIQNVLTQNGCYATLPGGTGCYGSGGRISALDSTIYYGSCCVCSP